MYMCRCNCNERERESERERERERERGGGERREGKKWVGGWVGSRQSKHTCVHVVVTVTREVR